MTSPSAGTGGGRYDRPGDALTGTDGTADPIVYIDRGVVFADPLAEGPAADAAFSLPPPNPATLIPQLSDPARRAAEAKLAAQKDAADYATRQARQTALEGAQRQSDRRLAQRGVQRETHSVTTAAGPGAASPYAARQAAAAKAVVAPSVAAPLRRGAGRPAAMPGTPSQVAAAGRMDQPAGTQELLDRLRNTSGAERTLVMRELIARTRAGRSARRAAARQGRSGRKSATGWGCAFIFVAFGLVGSGAGQHLIQNIVDLFNGR
ncbi:MAG: hypothetical protein M3Z00_04295 [Actinomycetota bacterium]|nr:hypothetical protein [Actinomycetota bacterium]